MDEERESIRAAAEAPHPKCGASEAEAVLLPRTGARSDSSHCTDGFRPVTFKVERIDE
jgi:uncharacterized repeat protein (TIGR04076 family)